MSRRHAPTPWPNPRPIPRGIAMLVVLAVLMIGLAAATTIARLTVTSSLTARAAHDEATLHALADAADERILNWLDRESGEAVLAPEAATPSVLIAADEWDSEQGRVRLTITAFDQAGMLPWSWATDPDSRGLPLTGPTLERLRSLEPSKGSVPGLDLLVQTGEPSPFPADAQSFAIGSRLATHPADEPSINVSTAPAWLLDLIETRQGLVLPESIYESRANGELPAVFGVTTDPSNSELPPVRLVNQSRTWSFRIDLNAGLVGRSWWVVYERGRVGWERRQRLAIP